MDRAVRVGVLGLRRGAGLARLARRAGMRVVAVCERDDRRRESVAAPEAVAYRDVEPFLEYGPEDVNLTRNETGAVTETVVTFLLPVGAPVTVDVPAPDCRL